MASDLISRKALLEAMAKWCRENFSIDDEYRRILDGMEKAVDLIEEQPTADAVEVVRQLWKKTTEEKPNSTKHLIVTDGGLISHYGYYVKPKNKWYKTWECKEEIPEPSFWMDMPEPPPESILDECCC